MQEEGSGSKVQALKVGGLGFLVSAWLPWEHHRDPLGPGVLTSKRRELAGMFPKVLSDC